MDVTDQLHIIIYQLIQRSRPCISYSDICDALQQLPKHQINTALRKLDGLICSMTTDDPREVCYRLPLDEETGEISQGVIMHVKPVPLELPASE